MSGGKDEQDKRRIALRNARALAVMTMFRLGMTYEEKVAALGLVSQIELALISYFKESVPEPGQSWDSHRRAREIERRLARLRWVEGEQQKERSGVRGMWNWLTGKPPLTGKMLYDKMIEHADGMLAAMNSEKFQENIVDQAMQFVGGGPTGGPGGAPDGQIRPGLSPGDSGWLRAGFDPPFSGRLSPSPSGALVLSWLCWTAFHRVAGVHCNRARRGAQKRACGGDPLPAQNGISPSRGGVYGVLNQSWKVYFHSRKNRP